MPGQEQKLYNSQLSSTILGEMDRFRQQGLFCDCTLVLEGQPFPIHKLVLAASSDYFRALFTTNLAEHKSSQIVLYGVPADIFEEVLHFVYTNEITLNECNITDIYTTADMLQLEHLRNLCHDYLINHLCASNCIGLWKFSKLLNNTGLTDIAEWYITTNFTQVKESSDFKVMSSAEMESIHHHQQQQQQQPPSLIVAGGFNAGMVRTCERYCKTTDSWENAGWDLSGSNKYFNWIGVIGLRLYAIGGSRLAQMDLVLSRLIDRAAQQLRTPAFSKDWECEIQIPHDCYSMQFCVLNDCIYGCGGGGADDEFGICRYSPSDGSWEKIADLHSDPKVLFQFFPHRNRLCILGGMLTVNESATNVFELYDLNSNTLESKADMIIPRYNFGAGLLGEHLFAVGGIGSDGIMLNSVEVYSFETRKWTFVSSLPVPKASVVCSGWNGALYCFGGESGNNSLQTNEVLKYNVLSDQWTKLSPLNTPRLHPCIISL